MKTNALLLPAALLLLTAPALAARTAVEQVEALLARWDPLSITQTGSVLAVILPQERISQDIYMQSVLFGICRGPDQGLTLLGINEIRILDETGSQGFVYEGGTEGCAEMNALPADQKPLRDIMILGRTHAF